MRNCLYVLGGITQQDLHDIKNYVINPVDSRQAAEDIPETLEDILPEPDDVEIMNGFCELNSDGLDGFISQYGLAMSSADIAFVQGILQKRGKTGPVNGGDTCHRHLLVGSLPSHDILNKAEQRITFDDKLCEELFGEYKKAREFVYGEKAQTRDVNLMDIATIYAKEAKKKGLDGRL